MACTYNEKNCITPFFSSNLEFTFMRIPLLLFARVHALFIIHYSTATISFPKEMKASIINGATKRIEAFQFAFLY
ncbi:hypothetical protein BPJM79_40403 [Bacillus pumilus]